MQILALISVYAPVVITILVVVAVVFSFFWVFEPMPHWMSNATSRVLVRFWRPEGTAAVIRVEVEV
jgi:hypothetical protein